MRVMLLGGGKIGGAIADLLQATGDFQITVADKDQAALARVRTKGVAQKTMDVGDEATGDGHALDLATRLERHAAIVEAHLVTFSTWAA